MRGKTHEHEHAAHMHHPRKRGGKVHHRHHGKHHAEGGSIMEAGGNPEVEAEAHRKSGTIGAKHGGKVKAHHGKHHRKHGGAAHHEHHHEHEAHERRHGGHVVEGKHAKHRLDRPGRKRGGRVGADTSPLSSAHHASDHAGPQPKHQQGGMSPV